MGLEITHQMNIIGHIKDQIKSMIRKPAVGYQNKNIRRNMGLEITHQMNIIGQYIKGQRNKVSNRSGIVYF